MYGILAGSNIMTNFFCSAHDDDAGMSLRRRHLGALLTPLECTVRLCRLPARLAAKWCGFAATGAVLLPLAPRKDGSGVYSAET